MPETTEVAQEQAPVQDQQPSIADLAAFAFNTPPATETQVAATTTQNTNGQQAAVITNAENTNAETIQQNSAPDYNAFIKETFGVDNVDAAKAEWLSLQELKAKPAAATETAFANEQSKKVHQYLKEGKIDEALEVYSSQKKIDKAITGEVNKDNAADIIKLKMQLGNKLLTNDDIEFQYRQDYVAPKEPVQKASEDEDDFKERHDEWKERVTMIEQKRIVAAKMAIPELEQLKTKIELPDIHSPQTNVDDDYTAYKASNASADEAYNNVTVPGIKALKETDVSLKVSINDANNKMQFDINIVPEQTDFEAAKQDSLSLSQFLKKTCYDKDGKFVPQNLQRLVLLNNNFDKYGQAIARQAVNAERKRVIETETAGSGMQRNFQTQVEASDLDKLKAFAFQ